jgi:hypothetical protein
MEPLHYIGLNVSQELTAVCVIGQQGRVVWVGNAAPVIRHGKRTPFEG